MLPYSQNQQAMFSTVWKIVPGSMNNNRVSEKYEVFIIIKENTGGSVTIQIHLQCLHMNVNIGHLGIQDC
jgi:hypothetical protein